MKYNIFINQKAIIENSKGLDIIDAAILDYLFCFCGVDNKKIKQMNWEEEGTTYRYTWINFKYLLQEMPILRINTKPPLTKRIERLKKNGFIKTIQAPNRSLYVRITEKMMVLFYEDKGVIPKEQGVVLKEQHNHITNKPITKSIYHSKTGFAVNKMIDLFKNINPSYEKFFKNKSQRAALERLINKFGEEKVVKVIRVLPETNAKKYAPSITTPLQLEDKLGALFNFFQKEKDMSKGKEIIL